MLIWVITALASKAWHYNFWLSHQHEAFVVIFSIFIFFSISPSLDFCSFAATGRQVFSSCWCICCTTNLSFLAASLSFSCVPLALFYKVTTSASRLSSSLSFSDWLLIHILVLGSFCSRASVWHFVGSFCNGKCLFLGFLFNSGAGQLLPLLVLLLLLYAQCYHVLMRRICIYGSAR